MILFLYFVKISASARILTVNFCKNHAGEMIVGPVKTLFMDEITNGLDISTTFKIVACLQQLAHISDATILISLLQPSPETFDLFDDIIIMAEGKTMYHGPRKSVLEFFEGCGFKCPERKAVADFLQEVLALQLQIISFACSDYFNAHPLVLHFSAGYI